MGTKNNSNLFYTCSLIEYIGRIRKQKRCMVLDLMGRETLERIYDYADVFHCEPIEKVASEFIEECQIPEGSLIMLETVGIVFRIIGQSVKFTNG